MFQSKSTRFVWVGGYPSHYMAELHRRLEFRFSNIHFLYYNNSNHNKIFSHEETTLPNSYQFIPGWQKIISVWKILDNLNSNSILISGNYPRVNLIAAVWAVLNKRDLYYMSDTNPLDSKNLNRNWINNFFLKLLFKRVTKILCIGRRNAEFFMQYFHKDSLDNILLPCPYPHINEAFELQNKIQPHLFTFLVFCRLEKIKGVDRVIRAYNLLSRESKNISRLVIAGDGQARVELTDLVYSLGLINEVDFLGSVRSNKAPDVFSKANVLILASHDEPWGLVVNEALSSGVPVIGPFWIGSFADLIIQGETGLVTTSNNPVELSKAMQKMLSNPENAKKMGLNGRKLIKEKNWNIDGSLKAFDLLPIFQNK